MRILLSNKSRKKLFNALKEEHGAKNLPELANKMNIKFKTLKKWRYAELYLPDYIIPSALNNLIIIDKQENNWGQISGGKIGGKKKKERINRTYSKEYKQKLSENGKRSMNLLWAKYGTKLKELAIIGKIKKREIESKLLEAKYSKYFSNETINLDTKSIKINYSDKEREIKFPKEMTAELAEEIGIHLGDGCMSFNRKYFSVKTNRKEEKYMTDFLIPLYKQLYNLDLKLMKLKSVCGFEICSQALCKFKNEILRIPYGEKINKIKVPNLILKTKNKEIYRSFIRGLFDTDGCLAIVKKDYPMIR